ncbi:MAG: hypothetical protein R3300_19680, partial [Candidatus Promineifilaceae bacterium]|nr:hypothetical protein [Candidatus Promineifilaceae bacterium]
MSGKKTGQQGENGWTVLAQETVLDNDWVQVHMQRVRLPDGEVIDDWPIVHTGDFVNVMAVNQQGQLLVLTGYKHGLGRDNWQVVGG